MDAEHVRCTLKLTVLKLIIEFKMTKFNMLIYIMVMPVFISIGESGVVFDRQQMQFEEREFVATFSLGILSFCYFCYLAILNKQLLTVCVIILSTILGIFGLVFQNKVNAVLVFQFWIVIIIILKLLKFYKENDLKNLAMNISKILILFQFLALINSYYGGHGEVVPNLLYIYNYEQYFSFAMIIGMYLYINFSDNKFKNLIYIVITYQGALDSENLSAEYFLYIYLLIYTVQLLIRNLEFCMSVKLFVSYLVFMFVILFPLLLVLLVELNPSMGFEELFHGRGNTYINHFKNFEIEYFIFPRFLSENSLGDTHNTYLTLAFFIGYVPALIITLSMVSYIKRISFKHILFTGPFLALTLSLTEPLQHQYTSYVYAIFLAILLRSNYLEINNKYFINQGGK